MRHNPKHAVDDERVVRTLIAENPWATIVSHNDSGFVASHYPVLLDDRSDELAVLTHVGRPDEEIHSFGTWNFSVAHCSGVPEILGPEENLRVLTKLVDHFEQR